MKKDNYFSALKATGSKKQKLNLKEENTSMEKGEKSIEFKGSELKEIPFMNEKEFSDLDFKKGIQMISSIMSLVYQRSYPKTSPQMNIINDLSNFMNLSALPDKGGFIRGFDLLMEMIYYDPNRNEDLGEFLCCFFFSTMELYWDLMKSRSYPEGIEPVEGVECDLVTAMEIFGMSPYCLDRNTEGQIKRKQPSIPKGKVS